MVLGVFATNGAGRNKPNASGSPMPDSETVIVPFDSKKPLVNQKPDRVYVPYERFIELWAAAKAAKRGAPPENWMSVTCSAVPATMRCSTRMCCV